MPSRQYLLVPGLVCPSPTLLPDLYVEILIPACGLDVDVDVTGFGDRVFKKEVIQ